MQFLNPDDHFVTIARADARAGNRRDRLPTVLTGRENLTVDYVRQRMRPMHTKPHIQIRNETAANIQAIEAVTTAAFRHAPHTSHTEQFIVSALRRAGQLTISLVADIEGTVIGQVTVSPVTISDRSSGWEQL